MKLIKKMIILFLVLPLFIPAGCGYEQSDISESALFQNKVLTVQGVLNNNPPDVNSDWWNTAWSKRRKVTIDNSAQTEDLTDFPLLVKLDSSRVDYTITGTNGEDIRFIDSDGTTELSYEVEEWNAGGDSFIWVKVPQIDGSSNSDYIMFYYGNTSASDGQQKNSVWDSHYSSVLHLNESSGTYYDSTANGSDGAPEGTPVHLSPGAVSDAIDLDAGTDRIKINVNLGATVTISTWAKLDTQGDMLWCIDESTGGPDLWFTSNNIYLNTWDGFNNPFSPQPANVNEWHYYSTVIDSVTTVLYIDGVNAGTATYKDPTETVIFIGSSNTTYTWDGSVDEFRISDTVRSADWVSAQYKSMNDSLITFGTEESQ